MLDILTSGFSSAKNIFSNKTTLTSQNIEEALTLVKNSLLEADVEYGVVQNFLAQVKTKALGLTVLTKAGTSAERLRVSAGDHFVAICKEELELLMGPQQSALEFVSNRPTVIMMVGLQGSGKTTTTGKLAKYLMRKFSRKPLLVAADIYRPAAVEQLKILGKKVSAPVFHIPQKKPLEICLAAVQESFLQKCNTVLLDTAGRLTIDTDMMQELKDIKAQIKPDYIFLVVDAMMGQDAVTTAKTFDEWLGITGVIMTKLDGDARGGAALSIRQVTGKPIQFLGMGEDLDRLEEFRPEGLASRILGLGDVVGLMEDFERVSVENEEETAMKMLQGQFSFDDFYEQLSAIQKMGSLKDIIAKLPMQNMLPKNLNIDDNELTKTKVMIDSMTKKERLDPSCFNQKRIERVAKGSGHKWNEVAELIKRFKSMRDMMAGMSQGLMGKMLGKIPGMGGLNQLNQMRKMAQSMGGGGGGFPGMGGAAAMGSDPFAGMFGGGPTSVPKKPVARDDAKKKRKQERNQRKKNRR